MGKGILVEEHSVKDLFKKLDLIHEQTQKTNGRVTILEKRSVGNWISNHPFKFTIFILIITTIVISDIRHPMLEILLRVFS